MCRSNVPLATIGRHPARSVPSFQLSVQDFLDLVPIKEVSRYKPLLSLPLPGSERANKLSRVLGMNGGCTYRYPDELWIVVDGKHTSVAWCRRQGFCTKLSWG